MLAYAAFNDSLGTSTNSSYQTFARGSYNKQQGVLANVLSALPKQSYHPGALPPDNASCCICLCEYEMEEELRILPCKHHFHVHCIDRWLDSHETCPLCIQSVTKGAMIQ